MILVLKSIEALLQMTTSLLFLLQIFFNRLELLARAQRRSSLGIGDIGDTFTDLTRLHHHPHPDGVDDVMAQEYKRVFFLLNVRSLYPQKHLHLNTNMLDLFGQAWNSE